MENLLFPTLDAERGGFLQPATTGFAMCLDWFLNFYLVWQYSRVFFRVKHHGDC